MKVVLIVEDNDKNMKLARDILQAKGYATLEPDRPVRRLSTRPQRIGHPDAVAGLSSRGKFACRICE